jgi:aspartate racemase
MLQAAARHLEAAGADCLLLCSNSMQKLAAEVEKAVTIPLLHIADATAAAIASAGLHTVALLGTRYSMEESFYRERLARGRALEVLTPETGQERDRLHAIILDELVHGIFREESRRVYQEAIAAMASRGAQGVILGCTEIPLLIQQKHSPLPVFDTTALHAAAAVDWALA